MKAKKLKSSSEVCRAFKNWLKEQEYELVSEFYPGAIEATVLMDDFIETNPGHLKQQVRKCAEKVGWVSDYYEGTDSEDTNNNDEREQWNWD